MIYARSGGYLDWGLGAKVTHILANTCLTEKFEELKLSQCTEAKHGMIKGCYFLDGHFTASGSMDSGTYNTIGTLSNNIEHLVLRAFMHDAK